MQRERKAISPMTFERKSIGGRKEGGGMLYGHRRRGKGGKEGLISILAKRESNVRERQVKGRKKGGDST